MTTTTYMPETGVDAEYLMNAVVSLRVAYLTWVTEMEELRDIEGTRPIGYSGTAVLSGVAASKLQQATTPYTEWTSGRLYVMRQNFVGRMVNSPCSIEAERVSSDRAEENRREALLSVAAGILHNLDNETARLGMGTSWRRLVAESSAFPGKIIGVPWVKQGRNGQAVVSCELWDPLTVWHDFNTWPRRVIHEWRTGAMNAHKWLLEQAIPGQAGFDLPEGLRITKPDQSVVVSDIWVEEPSKDGPDEYNVWRGILIDGKYAGRQLTGFAHLPVVIIATHANVASYQTMGTLAGGEASAPPDFRGVPYEAILNHAQPFYASLKHTQEQFKYMVSAIMEGVAKNLNPAVLIQSDKGNFDIPESQLTAGGRSRAPLDVKVDPINTGIQQIGEAVRICIDMFEKEFANLYDPTLLGQSGPGDSGFLNVQKTSHAKTVLNEPAFGCSSFVLGVFNEIIHQLQRNPDLKFRARDRSKAAMMGAGPSPMRDYSASDLPQDITLNVEWVPDLGDEAQSLNAAQNYVALGFPASEVWSRKLNVKNPQELMERADQERVRSDPRVQAMDVVQYFLEKWLEAQDAAARASNPQRKRSLQVTADYYEKQYTALEQQIMPQPVLNQGTPQGAPGTPPQVLPPEAMVGMNPDQNAAAQGLQSSATGGQGGMDVLGQGGGKKQATYIRNGKPIITTPGGVQQ